MPLIAFVTAYDEYAVQAFDVGAVDYLLKPVEKARLRETRIGRTKDSNKRIGAKRKPKKSKWRRKFTMKIRARNFRAHSVKNDEEIFLIRSAKSLQSSLTANCFIHDRQSSKIRHQFRLKDLKRGLDPAKFVRLSRGAIANLK